MLGSVALLNVPFFLAGGLKIAYGLLLTTTSAGSGPRRRNRLRAAAGRIAVCPYFAGSSVSESSPSGWGRT
jgi:hypothetical protein